MKNSAADMAADIENDIKNMLKGKNAAGMAGEKRNRPVSGDKRVAGNAGPIHRRRCGNEW